MYPHAMTRAWMAAAASFSLVCALAARADERIFDFATLREGDRPPGWRALRIGQGSDAEWRTVLADVPPTLKPLSDLAPKVARRAVITQVRLDPTDERYPLFVFDEERFGDFEAKTRLQVSGAGVAEMAGLVFRLVDENNFYVVRISTLGRNIRFYKFVNGQRSAPIGPDISISKGEWHELSIKCTGNRIEVFLDGKEAIPALTDNSHATGKVGFFTKSDSTAYFADLRLQYRPLESLAAVVLRNALQRHPRLVGLHILGRKPGSRDLVVLASRSASDVGRAANDPEQRTWEENRAYFTKGKDVSWVTLPIHDRNGDVLGIANVGLKAFPGQVESTTVARALPVVRDIEQRIGDATSLVAD